MCRELMTKKLIKNYTRIKSTDNNVNIHIDMHVLYRVYPNTKKVDVLFMIQILDQDQFIIYIFLI